MPQTYGLFCKLHPYELSVYESMDLLHPVGMDARCLQ